MTRFLEDPEAFRKPGSTLVADLIYGWGNEAWSALDEYLVGCLNLALTCTLPVLECGSGLSTILVGAIAQRRGYRHWALEHGPEWSRRVQRCLDRYGIDATILCSRPLKDYGDFVWYDPPLQEMPDGFGAVICDGPPGTTRGGRYGLLPVMGERLRPGCIILLDDAARSVEQATARRWEAELGGRLQVLGRAKPYARLTVPEPQKADRTRAG